MASKWICLVACALLNFCDSAFVDTLIKCSYKDDDCVAGAIQHVVTEVSENGIPDLNISPVDPLYVKNISIPIFGLLDVILDEGKAEGVKRCVVNSIHNDLEKGATNLDLTCNITIRAKFKLDNLSPIVLNLLGQSATNGDGNVKLKIENLHMKMQFFYHVVKKDDGDIYFKCHLDEFQSDYEIGNFKLTAKKILFGQQDISEFVESFLNQNWKFLMSTFGRSIYDVAMEILSNIINSYFENIPAKYYYTDDLTSFVKN